MHYVNMAATYEIVKLFGGLERVQGEPLVIDPGVEGVLPLRIEHQTGNDVEDFLVVGCYDESGDAPVPDPVFIFGVEFANVYSGDWEPIGVANADGLTACRTRAEGAKVHAATQEAIAHRAADFDQFVIAERYLPVVRDRIARGEPAGILGHSLGEPALS